MNTAVQILYPSRSNTSLCGKSGSNTHICYLLWELLSEVTVPLAKTATLDQDHSAGCKIKILNLNPNVRFLFHFLLGYTACFYSSCTTGKMSLRMRSFAGDLYCTEGRTCTQMPETNQKPQCGLCF